jgi:hypothetical protein
MPANHDLFALFSHSTDSCKLMPIPILVKTIPEAIDYLVIPCNSTSVSICMIRIRQDAFWFASATSLIQRNLTK